MEHVRRACSLLGLLVAGAALAWEGVPLNDHERLGQRFTALYPFVGLTVKVPSWLDSEGGLTLTLWDGPNRDRQLAQEVRTDIQDNAEVLLEWTDALPVGSYYWEVHDRTGQTRVGLYGTRTGEEGEDCAYFDGEPRHGYRFKFGIVPGGLYRDEQTRWIAVLRGSDSKWDREEACRKLAVLGGPDAVPALAELLVDQEHHHLARHALQMMDSQTSRAVLREALALLEGELKIGVIDSLGEIRDVQAVPLLRGLLRDTDLNVAAASAKALGKIATRSSSRALRRSLFRCQVQRAIYSGMIDCGNRFMEEGRWTAAKRLYDEILRTESPSVIREAALRGAMVARRDRGVPFLLRHLRGEDPLEVNTALWVIQHELPGERVTRALVDALAGLNQDKQLLLCRALCSRQDSAALDRLILWGRAGDKALRVALVGALPGFRDRSVLEFLVEMLSDPEEEISRAARESIANWPGPEADFQAMLLLNSSAIEDLLFAMRLARVRFVKEAAPHLLRWAEHEEELVSVTALAGLRDLAGPGEIPGMLRLLTLVNGSRLIALEEALRFALGRTEGVLATEDLIVLWSGADQELKKTLLRLVGVVPGERSFETLVQALDEENQEIRSTALRLVCDWKGPEGEEALLRLAREWEEEPERLLCLRSYLRRAGRTELPMRQRLDVCAEAASLVERDEEKRLLLGLLGTLDGLEALKLASMYLEDLNVKEEAKTAVRQIEERLLDLEAPGSP